MFSRIIRVEHLQDFVLFFIATTSYDVPRFVCSSADGHLDCFYSLALTGNAAMNVYTSFVGIYFCFLGTGSGVD